MKHAGATALVDIIEDLASHLIGLITDADIAGNLPAARDWPTALCTR